LSKKNTVVFVFLGEFGYELLNWQGRIRKFSENFPELILVAASREQCEILYRDSSKYFVSLSSMHAYNNSIADRYFCHSKDYKFKNFISEIIDAFHGLSVRKKIRREIVVELSKKGIQKRNTRFIFSDKVSVFRKYKFGAPRTRFTRLRWGNPDEIYVNLPTIENRYIDLRKNLIQKDFNKVALIPKSESEIALIQRAERSRVIRLDNSINEDDYLHQISKLYSVYLLDYTSNRFADTQGKFLSTAYPHIEIESLGEQVALLSISDLNLNFIHGDFRSNTYVAAFSGKQSFVITPPELYNGAYIEKWNSEVFSGEIVPFVYTANTHPSDLLEFIKNSIPD